MRKVPPTDSLATRPKATIEHSIGTLHDVLAQSERTASKADKARILQREAAEELATAIVRSMEQAFVEALAIDGFPPPWSLHGRLAQEPGKERMEALASTKANDLDITAKTVVEVEYGSDAPTLFKTYFYVTRISTRRSERADVAFKRDPVGAYILDPALVDHILRTLVAKVARQ